MSTVPTPAGNSLCTAVIRSAALVERVVCARRPAAFWRLVVLLVLVIVLVAVWKTPLPQL